MNKTVKGFVAFALVSTIGSTALFAAPRPRYEKGPARRPGIEKELDSKKSDYQTMVGKVRKTKWGFVTFETDDGNKFVLNATDNPDFVNMKDIKVKAGLRMVLSGKLDKDSNIFTVTHFGRPEGHHRLADAK